MVSFTIECTEVDDSFRERTMAQRKFLVMSVEDYLVLNRNSKDIRYEYLDGDVRMLAGGSPDHSIIIANLTSAIKGPLKGSQYRFFLVPVAFIAANRDIRVDIAFFGQL